MKTLDLLIPGLFDLPGGEFDAAALSTATPALHRLLRFATRRADDRPGFEDRLNSLLGQNEPGLPYARAALDDADAPGVLFSAVNLHADINNAVIQPVSKFNDDIPIIISDLGSYFNKDCDIDVVAEGIWSMRLKGIRPVNGMPHVYYALGRKVSHYLDLARDQLDWFRYLNEMQMFLHQHPLNETRLAAGLPIVNSLWCWGAEPWSGERFSDLDWFASEPELQALGRLYAPRSEAIGHFRADSSAARTLIIDLRLLKALKTPRNVSLPDLLGVLENEYLAPLLRGRGHIINLYTGSNHYLHYHPAMRFRLWRQQRFVR